MDTAQQLLTWLQNAEHLKWLYYALGCVGAVVVIVWRLRKFLQKPNGHAPKHAPSADRGSQAAHTTGNQSPITQTISKDASKQ